MNTRYEKSGHDLKIGEAVKVLSDGRWHFGRIEAFEQFEGSGLVFTDGAVRISGLEWAVGWGAVQRLAVR